MRRTVVMAKHLWHLVTQPCFPNGRGDCLIDAPAPIQDNCFVKEFGHRLLVAVFCLAAARGAAQTPLTNVTFVAFDTETTGFSARSNRLVEIGAVKFQNGEVLSVRSWLINPGVPIPKQVQQVHGITDQMVADAPPFAKIYPEFLAFIGDAVLLAHNARFDVSFMKAEAQRCGRPAPTNIVLDTLRLSRAWFPNLKSYSLGDLTKTLEIQPGTFHRGLADAQYLKGVLEVGIARHPDVTTLERLTNLVGVLRFGAKPAR